MINDEVCEACGKGNKEDVIKRNHIQPGIFPAFFNMHSHGLRVYNQRDICTTIDIGIRECARLINAIGMRVANGEHVPFGPGIHTDILANGMEVELIEFDDDPTLYLIIPDAQGRLPAEGELNEAVCDFPYNRQRLYAKMIHDGKDYV